MCHPDVFGEGLAYTVPLAAQGALSSGLFVYLVADTTPAIVLLRYKFCMAGVLSN
jgi:hypothetical protein